MGRKPPAKKTKRFVTFSKYEETGRKRFEETKIAYGRRYTFTPANFIENYRHSTGDANAEVIPHSLNSIPNDIETLS